MFDYMDRARGIQTFYQPSNMFLKTATKDQRQKTGDEVVKNQFYSDNDAYNVRNDCSHGVSTEGR